MTGEGAGIDVAAQSRLDDPRNVTDLLLRSREGDSAAWEEVVRRYGKLVSKTVRSFQLQKADELDAIQTTWLRLMTNWHRVQDPERLSGWLASTARQECLSIIRQSKRTAYRNDAPIDTAADPSATPEQRLLAAETVLALRSLVGELPLRGRTVLQALFSDNPRPYAEIARTTGIPVGSIGPTRARALRQLRWMLDERGLEPGAYSEVAHAAGIPTSSIGPTRARVIAPLRHRESTNTSGYPEPGVAESVEEVPPEGGRTGSYLLDDLLDKAEQALREKLEPKAAGLVADSSQGTGDTQLDDLLHRADAALRERQ